MKNKKILALIICATFFAGTIFGSNDGNNMEVLANSTTKKLKSQKEDTGLNLKYVGSDYLVDEYRDKVTGVHYLIYDEGYGGGITVRYNADGTVFAD